MVDQSIVSFLRSWTPVKKEFDGVIVVRVEGLLALTAENVLIPYSCLRSSHGPTRNVHLKRVTGTGLHSLKESLLNDV